MVSPRLLHESSGSSGAAILSAKFFSMEARTFTIALSSPWMTSSPVCEGDSGIHVVRSRMGSDLSSTVGVHLLPMFLACEKRTHSLANLPYSIRELPEARPRGGGEHPPVTDDDRVAGGAGDCHVCSVGVAHEAPVVPTVGPGCQEDDQVGFAALAGVNG
eukprot:3199347-Pyramimonas_sp.AAC.1